MCMLLMTSYYDFSNDENREVFPTKIKWPMENKMVTCPYLKLIHKNWGDNMEFTFDSSKCE